MNRPVEIVLPNVTAEQLAAWLEHKPNWLGFGFAGEPFGEGQFETAELRPGQISYPRRGDASGEAMVYSIDVVYLTDPEPFNVLDVRQRSTNVIGIRTQRPHSGPLQVTVTLNSAEPIASDLRLNLLMRLNVMWRGSVPNWALARLEDSPDAVAATDDLTTR